MPVMAALAREIKIILIPALVSSVNVFILIKFKVNILGCPFVVIATNKVLKTFKGRGGFK